MISFADSAAGVTVDLASGTGAGSDAAGDVISGIENIDGSSYDDTLTGDTGNNVLRGGAGNDSLTGGEGDDAYLFGRGDNQDVIDNFDDGESTDHLVIEEGVAPDQLCLREAATISKSASSEHRTRLQSATGIWETIIMSTRLKRSAARFYTMIESNS